MRRALFVGLLLAGASGSSGCEEQGTEIVFTVTSGYLAPEQINAADITVLGLGSDMTPNSADACRQSQTVRLGPDERVDDFPFTFAVRAGSVCNDRVFFTVTLLKDGLDVVASSGSARFEPGKSVAATISIPRNQTCPVGQQYCGTGCTDTLADGGNCGWCGNVCEAPLECRAGWCACPDGKSECGGTCIDIRTDPDNCGGCEVTCGDGEACQEGSCTSTCPTGQELCERACVDVLFDSANCGSCGNACPAGERCQNGSCGSCTPLQGGQCDVSSHCGCATGDRCDAAQGIGYGPNEVCVPAGTQEAGMFCDEMYRCARGLGCFPGGMPIVPLGGEGGPLPLPLEGPVSGICLPWCVRGDPDSCGGYRDSCYMLRDQPTDGSPAYGVCLMFSGPEVCNWIDDDGDASVDEDLYLLDDFYNCGECFNMCAMGEMCFDGSCLPGGCRAPYEECGAECVDLESDPYNCGWCGTVCDYDEICGGSQCIPDSCALPSFSLCFDPAGAPYCADTANDPDNCGTCEVACSSTETCQEWTCAARCLAGGTPCGQYCVNTDTDPRFCGACGTACTPGQQCVDRICTSCEPAPPLGGTCYPPTGCGCPEGERCVLEENGTVREACAPTYGEIEELAPCLASVPTCGAGLQCLPPSVAALPGMNRCARLCTTSDECPNGTCIGTTESYAPYGICRSIGSPCDRADSTSCPGFGTFCVETAGPLDGLVPGGYCSAYCDEATPCPWGARCASLPVGELTSVCLAVCATDADCRESEGYQCTLRLGEPRVCFREFLL